MGLEKKQRKKARKIRKKVSNLKGLNGGIEDVMRIKKMWMEKCT